MKTNKKAITIEKKAERVFGYKRYVEKFNSAETEIDYERIDYQCYLLSVIMGDEAMSLMLAPKGTKLVCVKIPKDGRYGFNEKEEYIPLVIGQEYTVIKSYLSEWCNSKIIEGCDNHKYNSFWFKIENPLSKEKALEIYGESFEQDYFKANEYYLERKKQDRAAEEERKKALVKRTMKFKPTDFESGDIVVYEDDVIGVVLKDIGMVVYQSGGYNLFEDFDDNMSVDDYQVLKVYRGVNNFTEYEEGELVYNREVL